MHFLLMLLLHPSYTFNLVSLLAVTIFAIANTRRVSISIFTRMLENQQTQNEDLCINTFHCSQ
ncbi:hypothetical protein THOD04_150036 [Vibrio owensii]|nr:hypothetical protein THOD04_150036 [Vibrio owensii]